MFRTIALYFFLLIQAANVCATQEKICTQAEAMAAEIEASTLKSWSALYKSFKRYAQCDDAAISEGYSATVARLLSADWTHFGNLRQYAVADKAFEVFVLKHIDETWSTDDAIVVRQNIDRHCRSKVRGLCRHILNSLNVAESARALESSSTLERDVSVKH